MENIEYKSRRRRSKFMERGEERRKRENKRGQGKELGKKGEEGSSSGKEDLRVLPQRQRTTKQTHRTVNIWNSRAF